MKPSATIVVLALLASCHHMVSPVQDNERLRQAFATNNCRLVDKVFFAMPQTDAEREFLWACWAQRQREIVPTAMSRGDCRAVLTLPGMYPLGSDDDKRFVYHCWMREPQMDLDTCIGMTEVGDATSRELIISALQRNPPVRMPQPSDRKFALIDTAGACLSALQRIDGLNEEQLKTAASRWGEVWAEWSREPGPIFGTSP